MGEESERGIYAGVIISGFSGSAGILIGSASSNT